MSEAALFDVPHQHVGGPLNVGHAECAPKWTERLMLDALIRRYGGTAGNGPRYAYAEHVRSETGWARRCMDFFAMSMWHSDGEVMHGHEVKVSRSDWLTELKDPGKAEAFRPFVDHWWLVASDKAIVRDDLPDGWGLMVADRNGRLRVTKPAPKIAREPMPKPMWAALLRATAKTAVRGLVNDFTEGRFPDCERYVKPATCETYQPDRPCTPCRFRLTADPEGSQP